MPVTAKIPVPLHFLKATGLIRADMAPRSSISWMGLLLLALYVAGTDFGHWIFYNPSVLGPNGDSIGQYYTFARLMLSGLIIAAGCVTLSGNPVLETGFWPLIPFIAVSVMSISWAHTPEVTVKSSMLLVLMSAALAVACAQLGGRNFLRTIVIGISLSIVLSFLVGAFLPSIGQHNSTDLTQNGHAGLWRGIFRHKNELGSAAALAFVLMGVFGKALGFRFLSRIVVCVSALICIALAGSATGVVASVAGVAVYLFFFKWGSRTFLGGVVRALLLVACFPLALQFLQTVLEALGKDTTLTGRSDIWRISWELASERATFGYGSGFGTEIARDYLRPLLFSAAVDSHNAFLDQLLDVGFVGAMCLLAVVAIALFKTLHPKASTEADRMVTYAFGTVIVMLLFTGMSEVAPLRINALAGMVMFASLIGAAAPIDASKAIATGPLSRKRHRTLEPAREPSLEPTWTRGSTR